MTTEQMAARCGARLLVQQSGSGWLLAQPCPKGYAPGAQVNMVLQACTSCELGQRPAQMVQHADALPAIEKAAPLPFPPQAVPPPQAFPPMPTVLMPPASLPVSTPAAAAAPPPVEPVAMATVPPPLPELQDIVLPSGLTMADDAGMVDVEAVMHEKMPGLGGGPSEGGLSPHILADAGCWRRFYYAHVRGLRPRRSQGNLSFGTLFHYCMAARYSLGAERQYDPCEFVAQAGAAEMAAEVKKLVSGMVDKYGAEEWHTWSVRAVEHNLIAWLNKKIPLTSRIDLIISEKSAAEPHPGPGPVEAGISLVDHKTSSTITFDLLEGFSMDWQFNIQAAIYQLGDYESVFGPLKSVKVNIASKARKDPTPDSYARITSPMPFGVIHEFVEEQLEPIAEDVWKRLHAATRESAAAWPKDYRQCHGRWSRCPYFRVCESGEEVGAVDYVVNEAKILLPEKFAQPPKTKAKSKPAPAAKAAAAAAAEPPAGGNGVPAEAEKKEAVGPTLGEQMLAYFAYGLLMQVESNPQFGALRKENFLGPDKSPKAVEKELTDALKGFYSGMVGTDYNTGTAMWKFTKSGLSWSTGAAKGRVTWKGIAEQICADWFNPAKAMPE